MRARSGPALIALCFLSLSPGPLLRSQEALTGVAVRRSATLDALLEDEDTDHDRRITVRDTLVPGTHRGDRRFTLVDLRHQSFEVSGTYPLANLLQELGGQGGERGDTLVLRTSRIFELPVDRMSRLIRDRFWSALTRTVDEEGLRKVIADQKIAGGKRAGTTLPAQHLYVPAEDTLAVGYFRRVLERHPDWRVTLHTWRRTDPPPPDTAHGLLSLALEPDGRGGLRGVPFVVPGGRFNEMYGWDSYFIVLGLVHDGKVALARGMVDNQVYEIERYGSVLNANRTYYLTRSQPPFLTSMIRAVWEATPASSRSLEWLRRSMQAAIDEYRTVWTAPPHLTAIGLSRYRDRGSGVPPEVEPGHFAALFARFAARIGMDAAEVEHAYRTGEMRSGALDTAFIHDRAMRESGHDTSTRLEGICADLATVDLNSLLYKVEMDLAELIRREYAGRFPEGGGKVMGAHEWEERAARRNVLLDAYCWDSTAGTYYDYDLARREHHRFVSATSFYPLWAGAASQDQAERVIATTLPLIEMPGGIAATDERSRGMVSADHPQKQWDYPNGWAPHQMIVWEGLRRTGHPGIAARLAYRWLYTMVSNAVQYNGVVTEKYDVVRRSHEVFAEYGNVGATFSLVPPEGFGWTNASFVVGRALLAGEEHVAALNRLLPPEWVFSSSPASAGSARAPAP